MGIKLKEIMGNGKYCQKDTEFSGNNDDEVIWSISGPRTEEKVYTYDEAIDLTGNGWYNVSLLLTLVLAVQGMALDMFGFTYVVAAAACDLQLSHNQTSFLLSVPLIGAVTSAYFHGYMTDTRGRKKCLIVVLWGSFIAASLTSLSPNIYVLAVLKFISSSMCSGAQSMSYTLLGESCSGRTKGSYMLILTSSLVCGYAVFSAHTYFVLGLDFAYDLGFIIFKPWRLLILTLAMALGFSAVLVDFFYESPKFLINAGRTSEAVEILKNIKKRNRGGDNYEVKKVILLEENSSRRSDGPFLRTLWDQTAPLFQPPLLGHTLLLFYITAAIYSVNNGFFLWIPILTRSIFDQPSNISIHVQEGFCSLFTENYSHGQNPDCTKLVSVETLLMATVQGVIFLSINFGVSMLAHKKKILVILMSVLSSFCCFAMLFITEKFTTIVLFFGVQINCLTMGIIFCYFIELYPTRYRGMISCLGVMVARASGMAGVNLVGAYTFTHCVASLYCWGAYIFSGALVAFLLPPNTPKKLYL